MDRDLETNLHLLEDNIASDTILKVHNVLQSFGFIIGDSSTLLLYDPEMEMDFDIEPAINIENTIKRMVTWPLLGVVGYEYKDWIVDVSFIKYKEKESIHCVSLAFPEDLYRNSVHLTDIKNLIMALHNELGAVRTIVDVEIENAHVDYDIDHEIDMLRKNKIQGEYWLDIINKSFFSVKIEELSSNEVVESKEIVNNIFMERERKYITEK